MPPLRTLLNTTQNQAIRKDDVPRLFKLCPFNLKYNGSSLFGLQRGHNLEMAKMIQHTEDDIASCLDKLGVMESTRSHADEDVGRTLHLFQRRITVAKPWTRRDFASP